MTIRRNPEFEYILDSVYSMTLCYKCSIPINHFFTAIENKGYVANSLYEAMEQVANHCIICGEYATKHYFRKKEKRHIVLCKQHNAILEVYLKEIILGGGKIRNFSQYTEKLNTLVMKALRTENNK